MPIHNWKKAPAGLFHHFHQRWVVEICDTLNFGTLPTGFFALLEQKTIGVAPDVMTLIPRDKSLTTPKNGSHSGIAVKEAPPKTRFTTQVTDRALYARKANRIAVRNSDGELVNVIELVSPGNKDDHHAINKFVEKANKFLAGGVNLLIIDLFPPTRRDPQGIHKAIWDQIVEEPFKLPPGKRLTLAAYTSAPDFAAYVEPVGVGDVLTAMPLFLDPGHYVLTPLEETYQRTWDKCPAQMRKIIDRSGATGSAAE